MDTVAGRANRSSRYFQAKLYKQLREELGYNVSDPGEIEPGPNLGCIATAQGEMDYWPNSWYPAHLAWLAGDHVTIIGEEMLDGGLRGFWSASPSPTSTACTRWTSSTPTPKRSPRSTRPTRTPATVSPTSSAALRLLRVYAFRGAGNVTPVITSLFLAPFWFVDYSFDRDFGDGVDHWLIIAAAATLSALFCGLALYEVAMTATRGQTLGKLAIRERVWSSGTVMHRFVAVMALMAQGPPKPGRCSRRGPHVAPIVARGRSGP